MSHWQEQQEPDHIATGGESLRELAVNAGMDSPDRAWLLDPRDVRVANPYYHGPRVPHPEDENGRAQEAGAMEQMQQEEQLWPSVVEDNGEDFTTF